MDNFDLQAYNFLKWIVPYPQLPMKQHHTVEFEGIDKIIEIKTPEEMEVGAVDSFDKSYVSRYRKVNGVFMGLPEPIYGEFKELVTGYLQFSPFLEFCTLDYVEKEAFKWLMVTYQEQRAQSSLSAHLLTALDRDNQLHTFYFRIAPFALEKGLNFKLGKTKITPIHEQQRSTYLKEYLSKKDENTEEKFSAIWKEHFSGVFCKISIQGVFARAEEIATQEAYTSVNILKLFFVQESLEPFTQLFDIDIKSVTPVVGNFISIVGDDFSKCLVNLRRNGGNVPIHLTRRLLMRAAKDGLNYFSEFLFKSRNTELVIFIKQCIDKLAKILATANNYEKIVQSISLIESIAIPVSATGRSKGESRVKQLLPRILADEQSEKLAASAIRMSYDVRDRYLHNAQHLPINREKLFQVLIFQRVLLFTLMRYSSVFTTFEEVQNDLNSR